VFLCGIHAKMYLAINYLAISSCVAGKSNLFRKSDLERAAEKRRRTAKGLLLAEGEGGLAAFGKYLGEDNMMAESIWNDLGMRHAMGSDLAANPVGTMSFNSFFRRRVRWIRVRKYMVVFVTLLLLLPTRTEILFSSFRSSTLIEPLTECFLTAIIGAHALQRFFAISFFFTLSFHIIFSFVLDCILFHTLTLSSPSTNRSNLPQHDGPGLAFLRAWLVRESMALPIWTFAMLGNTISWRDEGEKYTVLMDGSVQRLTGDDGLVDRILRWTTKLSYRRQKYEQLERKDEHAVS
jgi:ceramide glucosyltransferase